MLSLFSCVRLCATLWTVAHQASLSMGFSRQEYCSGLPCPPPGDLPDGGLKPESLMSPELAGGFFTISTTWESRTEDGGGDVVTKSCPTLATPWTGNLPGCSVHGILQARILEWVAISFSRELRMLRPK